MSNCYAIIWKPSDNSWGFYNLGILDTISFNGFDVTNPVFSYCPDGKVRIYPRNQMYTMQRVIDGVDRSYTVGGLKLSRAKDKIDNFTDTLIESLDKNSDENVYSYTDENTYYIECPFKKTDELFNYTQNYYNCFYAVAKWFEDMDKPDMFAEFAPSLNACYEYIPAAFKASNYFTSSNWLQTTFDGSADD